MEETAIPRSGLNLEVAEFTDPWHLYPELLPELDDDFREMLLAVPLAVARATAFIPRDLVGAPRMVVAHAMNDFILLVEQVVDCDGRSASRTARAIFEHLVNWVSVQDLDTSHRYTGYAYTVADRLADLGLGLDLLTGDDRRKEKDLLARVKRRTASKLRLFRKEFSSPRKPWLDTLKARAESAGYADHYRLYGVLSGVAHGDSGSLLGLRKQVSDNTVIHRTGPDLELARIAYLAGIRWMTLLLDRLAAAHPCEEVSQLATLCRQLTSKFPQMHRALRKLDRQLWPESAPNAPPWSPSTATEQGGTCMILTPGPLSELNRLRMFGLSSRFGQKAPTRSRRTTTGNRGRPLVAHAFGVQVRPLPDAQWVACDSVLPPHDHSAVEPGVG